MFSRKLTSITLLTITLSAGAASRAPAWAAQGRDSGDGIGASVHAALSIRSMLDSVLDLAHTVWATKGDPPPQNPPPGPLPRRKNSDEGTGICPNGQQWWNCPHPGNGQGNGQGNSGGH
jgi:hypothetical protein